MMNKELLKKDLKRLAAVLTVVTNCFIISGVIHHWRPKEKPTIKNESWNNTYRYTYDNTELAAPFKEIAEIQEKTTDYTSSEETD
jgi:hypothetical protein